MSVLDSPVQATPSQVASGAQLTSCTAWRQGAVAQAVQILKQTPKASRWGQLDSPEHTNFSQLAARKPLLPLAGPGDVVLSPRLIWILKQRELRAPAEASGLGPKLWAAGASRAASSQTVSGCTLGLLHFLETERCGPVRSDPKAGIRRLPLGPAGFTGAY